MCGVVNLDILTEGPPAVAPESDNNERFVRLLAGSQQDVLRYVRALVQNDADAHDVMQETAVALWRKFDQYDAAQDFLPWAIAFARKEVYNLRKRRRRENRDVVMLGDDVVELLAEDHVEHHDVLAARRRALRYCLKQISDVVRKLLTDRYANKKTIVALAAETGENVQTLYKRLARARHTLFECVTRRLAEEEDQ